MKILFIGCVASSEYLLRQLLVHNKNICGVVTKIKSEFNSDFVNLAPLCKQSNIPVCFFAKDRERETIEFIKNVSPDIIYCFGWSHLLSKEIIDLAPLGVVGFHPAALPQNRGRHPLIWALVLGLKETASTFFMITEGVDEGAIVSQRPIQIDEQDTAETLSDKVFDVAGEQVLEFTELFEQGVITNQSIDKTKTSNMWRKRSKRDGIIDFRMSAKNIYNLVRALSHPYPGASFFYNEKEYIVWKSELVEGEEAYSNIEHGKVLEVCSPDSFVVKTGDGLLKILACEPSIEFGEGDYL